MAYYSSVDVWFRGRLVAVTFRYGCYNGARVIRGKPLRFADDYSRDYPFQDQEERYASRGLLRVMRHKGIVGKGSRLIRDPFLYRE